MTCYNASEAKKIAQEVAKLLVATKRNAHPVLGAYADLRFVDSSEKPRVQEET